MKRFTKRLWLTIVLAALLMPAQAGWYYQDLARAIEHATNVEEAVDVVREALERQGYEIVLTVDHAAAAASVGLELGPTQLIFASPPARIERALLHRSRTVGIDLPIKILVFEDPERTIQIRYNPVGYLTDRHDIKLHDPVLRRLERTARQFVDPDSGLITVASRRSLQDTASALEEAIKAAGTLRIPLVLDYGDGKHRRKPILIVFGNPMVGTPLMQATQEIGIDLPQKFLIWEDRRGDVHISYNDPFFIAKRHNLQGQDESLENIRNALARLAAAGAGE